MKRDTFTDIEYIFKDSRQKMISLVDNNISLNESSRCSTLNSNVLTTILAHTALKTTSEKTRKWLMLNAKGEDIIGFPTSFSESSPLMHACFTIVEEICGFQLPPQFKKKLPSIDEIEQQLDYSCSHDASYILSFHLAVASLFCTLKGEKVPEILDLISGLQQEDGSWTDDTLVTALSALALQKGGVEPRYDVQTWLKRQQLPDGSWAVANGEVWEASYALRTGLYPDTAKLKALLTQCIHPNYWWGYSRYAVPDADDTGVACCALAPYEPHLTSKTCEKLCKVQHENGGWGAFPEIQGIVPNESVIGKSKIPCNDITCHVLEAFEQNQKSRSPSFKRGITYLLESQEEDGSWETMWWNSNIYATAEIALLMHRHGYSDPAFCAMDWLEKKKNQSLNLVEYALLIMAFSKFSDFSDNINWVIHYLLKKYSSESFITTFDSVYFCGLINCKVYNLSLVVSSLHTLLNLRHNLKLWL
jgi:hypothetical protein